LNKIIVRNEGEVRVLSEGVKDLEFVGTTATLVWRGCELNICAETENSEGEKENRPHIYY